MLALAVIDGDREVRPVVHEILAPGRGEPVILTVAFSGNAPLDIDFEAFEVVFHDEVDDAGNSIGAVNGRGAAGQYLDALDQRGRDRIDVDGLGTRRTGYVAPAVDEHEGAFRAHAAKLEHRLTGRAENARVVGVERGACRTGTAGADLTGQQRGNRPHDFGDVDLARQADVFAGYGLDGNRSAEVRVASDARAGNDDVVDDLALFLRKQFG